MSSESSDTLARDAPLTFGEKMIAAVGGLMVMLPLVSIIGCAALVVFVEEYETAGYALGVSTMSSGWLLGTMLQWSRNTGAGGCGYGAALPVSASMALMTYAFFLWANLDPVLASRVAALSALLGSVAGVIGGNFCVPLPPSQDA